MKTRWSIFILVVGTALAILLIAAPPPSTQAKFPADHQAAPLTPQSIPGKVPIEVLAGHGTEVYRLSPPAEFRALRPATATFIIDYVPAGSTNALDDLCYDWPAGSKAAFTYAANVWGTLLNSPVPIKIEACWAQLPTNVLGHSATDTFWRNFTGAPQSNTWYPVALADALSGTDQNGSDPEIHIAYSDAGISWYFGTDGGAPLGEYDFVSVVMHEIAHGLGFAGSMRVSSGQGSWGFTGYSGTPVSYDRFIENGSAQSLINTGLFPNPSAALAAQLTGNNLYFNGTNATAANGGSHPKMYAPSTWAPGSSYSHLDYATFSGTINRLMVYAIDDGASIHDPGPVTMGLLKDNGWPAAGNPAPTLTSLDPASALPGGPDFTLTVNGTNFIISSVVQWDGSPRTTTVVDSTQLTAIISATDILITGTASVTVYNPDGGGTSNAMTFIVANPQKVYLPLIARRWPPIPDVPTLNAIADHGSGNYDVTWNAAYLADSYVLQEATNASFTSPTNPYLGSGTGWSASSKPTGTYYYRVKASNSYGDSGWSNTQSVQVVPPTTTVYVQNDTGGQLCYEVYSSGIGNKCYSSGQNLYGTFPAGTYSWHASARCGSANGTQYYPPGTWIETFSCN